MTLLQTLLAFIVVLGVLITVHEAGHYLVARWCGVKVLRFSIGFGRAVWSRRLGRDQTEWVIAALPLGGYVAMLDDREPTANALSEVERQRAFNRQSPWRRIAIVLAGPVANLVLAVVLFAGLFAWGVEEPRARLAAPPPDSIMAAAGFRAGDEWLAIEGKPVDSWADARWALVQAATARRVIEVEVLEAGGAQRTRRLDLRAVSPAMLDAGFPRTIGAELAIERVVIAHVEAGSPAAQAGLRADDELLALNGERVFMPDAVSQFVRAHPDEIVSLRIQRADEELTLDAQPRRVVDGEGREQVRLGIMVTARPAMKTVQSSPIAAIVRGAAQTWELGAFSLRMLARMVTGEASLKNLSGVVSIADHAGQAARSGLESYVHFMALISISLGILNLLPIPMLDGGQLLYYSVELIKGRPLSQRFIDISQRTGLAMLIALMAVALVNDLTRLFA